LPKLKGALWRAIRSDCASEDTTQYALGLRTFLDLNIIKYQLSSSFRCIRKRETLYRLGADGFHSQRGRDGGGGGLCGGRSVVGGCIRRLVENKTEQNRQDYVSRRLPHAILEP
jgi:hypothetical protein